MNKLLACVCLIFFVLAGCSNQADQKSVSSLPIKVDLKITPDTPKVNDTVTFFVTVKQGEESVDDAHDVQFEIWKQGQDNHEFLTAQKKGSGVYSAEKKFDQAATYFVMYHVTAREMHSMNKQPFAVQGTK